MYCVRSARAAIVSAAASLVCCVCASAGPAWSTDAAQLLLFSGVDLWRDGQFVHGGFLWSPAGLDREGFTLKAMLAGGRYRYLSGALNNVWVTGTEEGMQVLPGWRFKGGGLEAKLFAGLDIKNDVTNPFDPSSRLRGTAVGVRMTVDLWFEPTPATMLAANATLTSINTDYSMRVAYGWRWQDWLYVGPEAQAYACEGYRQLRFGAHLTALKTGGWEWSAAGGWSRTDDGRTGAYLRLGILTRP
jgi:hypothetical protein